jgi:hypothetical protein
MIRLMPAGRCMIMFEARFIASHVTQHVFVQGYYIKGERVSQWQEDGLYAARNKGSPPNFAGAMWACWLWQKHLCRPTLWNDHYRLIRPLPCNDLRR